MTAAGAVFLLAYGVSRFRAAYGGNYQQEQNGTSNGLWVTLATGAAFTWLNPHVYLDTFGLVGAVSTGFELASQKWAFGIGAVTASFVFFFGLGYGARLLAPIMGSAKAWRYLDVGIGVTMWILAFGLICSL